MNEPCGPPTPLNPQPENTVFWVIDADGWLPIRRQPVTGPELDIHSYRGTIVDNGEEAYGDSVPGMTLEQWNRWTDQLINRSR